MIPDTLPKMHPDDASDAWREWARLLDAGAIPLRVAPPAPAVAAIRDANEALFRRLAAERRAQR